MSIQSEINRISGNVANALTAIANKGVTVQAGSNSDNLADLIGQISGGITPTGNINITQAGATDVTNYATATVPSATPSYIGCSTGFFTENNVRKWKYTPRVEVAPWDGGNAGWLDEGEIYGSPVIYNAIATNTTITPSTSSQTIGGANYMMEGPVTIAAMPSGTAGTPTATKGAVVNNSVTITPSVTNTTGYITGGAKTGAVVTVYASELVSGTLYCDGAGTWDVTNAANFVVDAGTAGTPTATKSAVSNHAVTVTPSVTNTEGWITGSTKTGTAVTVSASELVSGSETKTANGTYNVTNLASLVVAVPIVTYYTGSSAPSSALGSNGDIYLQTGT